MAKAFKRAAGEGIRRAEKDRAEGLTRIGGRWSGLHYATSYAQAARMLFDAADNQRKVAKIAVPCLFLLRHSLELALKDLAGMLDHVEQEGAALQQARGERITFTRLPEPDRNSLMQTHDLGALFKLLERGLKKATRPTMPKAWKGLVKAFIELERSIPERFRYSMVLPPKRQRSRKEKPVHVRSFTETEVIPIRDLLERFEMFFHEAVSLDLSTDARSWFMELGNEANHYGVRLIEIEEFGPE